MTNYRLAVVAAIAASGMLVAATSSFGVSLSQLMEFGSPAAVREGVAGKATVESRDKDGATPLMIAAGFNQNPNVISALLKAGAKIDDHAHGNVTPIMYAAFNQNPQVASVLIKAGANVNATEWDGETPLMVAAGYNRNPLVISTLLKAGAKIDQRDSRGMTALMFASQNPNPAIITELIKAGANGQLRSKDGKTAYDYAAMNVNLKGTSQLDELRSAAQTGHTTAARA